MVMTGAGISTESGIPDYRSEGVGLYATSEKRPIQHKVFMDSIRARQSYWARNFVGWPRWSSFLPNISHRTLAKWEETGRVSSLVTQNVDQLHYKAGSRRVIELHGTNSTVTCMSCTFTQHRGESFIPCHAERGSTSLQGWQPKSDRAAWDQQHRHLHELHLHPAQAAAPEGVGGAESQYGG